MWGEGKETGRKREGQGSAARRPQVQERKVTKIAGLYKEETLGKGSPGLELEIQDKEWAFDRHILYPIGAEGS